MLKNLRIMLAGTALMLAFLAAVGLPQQTAPKAPAKEIDPTRSTTEVAPGDWPMYSRDLTSSRYSPLKQINRANVSKLAKTWSYRPSAGSAPPPAPDEKGAGKGDEKGAGKGKGKGRGGAPAVVAE